MKYNYYTKKRLNDIALKAAQIIALLSLLFTSFCFANIDNETQIDNLFIDVSFDTIYIVNNNYSSLSFVEKFEVYLTLLYIEDIIDNEKEIELGLLTQIKNLIYKIAESHNVLLPSMIQSMQE